MICSAMSNNLSYYDITRFAHKNNHSLHIFEQCCLTDFPLTPGTSLSPSFTKNIILFVLPYCWGISQLNFILSFEYFRNGKECAGYCLADSSCTAFFWNPTAEVCQTASASTLAGDLTTAAVDGYIDNTLQPSNPISGDSSGRSCPLWSDMTWTGISLFVFGQKRCGACVCVCVCVCCISCN